MNMNAGIIYNNNNHNNTNIININYIKYIILYNKRVSRFFHMNTSKNNKTTKDLYEFITNNLASKSKKNLQSEINTITKIRSTNFLMKK